MKHVKESEFAKEAGNGLVLLDFDADWGGPCKMLTPVLEGLEKKNKNVKFLKVNIDECRTVASYYGIFSIPTVILLNNGREINRIVGFNPKERIQALIDSM